MTVSRVSRSSATMSKPFAGFVLAGRFLVVQIGLAILLGISLGHAEEHQRAAERVRDDVQNGPPLRLTPRRAPGATNEQATPALTPSQPVNVNSGPSTGPVVTVDHLESLDPESV